MKTKQIKKTQIEKYLLGIQEIAEEIAKEKNQSSRELMLEGIENRINFIKEELEILSN